MGKLFFSVLFSIVWAGLSAQELYTQQNNERLYKTGLQLIERKEFGAARITFEEFLTTSPKTDIRTIEAEYYKAYCALNLYNQDGEKLVEDFIQAHPNHPRSASVYYDLANFFYAEKNYGRASEYFLKVDFSSLSASQINAGRFKWGYSFFNQKKLVEALDQFNFIKAQGGQFGPASTYYAGFIEYNKGDYQNALADLKRAEENESYSSIVPYLIASSYLKQAKYDELFKYAASIQSRENISNKEDFALVLAEAYFKKPDYNQAYEGYKKYLDGKGTLDRGVLSRAGFSAFSMGKDDDAFAYFKQTASNKDSVGYYSSYYLGVLYLKRKQKQLALNAFDVSRKFNQDKRIAEESLYQFSKIAFDLDRGDIALDGFENYLKLYPLADHVTEVKELLSQAYVTTNNYDKAIDYIESLDSRRGDALNKAYQKATFYKGTELFNKEEYAKAQIYFKKSLKDAGDANVKAETLYWLGETYSIDKNYEQSVEQYKDVIDLQASVNKEVVLKTRYSLGYAYFNLQQYDKALFNFKDFVNKATNQSSNFSDASLRLADCYYVTKSYNEALDYYRNAIKLKSPDADYAYLQAGNIYSIQGKYNDAASQFDMVIKTFPTSRYIDEVMFQRAQLDFEQGNYAVAVNGFTKLIDSGKPSKFLPYAFVRRASSYYNLKEFNKTAADYITILEQYSTHPVADDVLLPLQEALTNAGRSAEFDKYLAIVKANKPGTKGLESVEFESAKGSYFNQDYAKAISTLGNFIAAYPQSPKLNEANYYRAESLYRLKDFAKATEAYYQMASLSDFSFSNKIAARIAELEFKNGNYEKAIPAFWKMNKLATTKKEQFNAWSGLMESHFILKRYDSVEYYAHAILERAKVSAGAENKASLYLGKAAMGKGENENAKDEFLNTLNNAQDEFGAEAKYLLAELQFKNKEYKQCYETILGVRRDFTSYQIWIDRSYLLLADYYLAVGDKFNCRVTLQGLIDQSGLPMIKDKAKEKLKALDEDESKKQVQDTIVNQKN